MTTTQATQRLRRSSLYLRRKILRRRLPPCTVTLQRSLAGRPAPKRAVFPEDAASLRAWSYYLTAAGIQHRISQLTHFTLSPVLRRQMVFASRIGMPMATEAGAFDSVSFCRSSAMTAANLHSGNIAIKLVESVAAHAFPDHQGVGVAPHPAPWKSRPDAVQQGSRGWRLQALQRSRQEGRLPWCQSP